MSEVDTSTEEFSIAEIAQDHILQFFHYSHLPESMRERSKPFCALARQIIDQTPRNPERTVALRKLLEAKDANVRAFVAALSAYGIPDAWRGLNRMKT